MAVAIQPPWMKALHARSAALNGSLIKPPGQNKQLLMREPDAPPGIAPPAAGGDAGGGGGGGGGGVPPPAVAPITVGAYNPDYAALINADPTLLGTEADITDYTNRLGDARQQAIRKAIISGGFTGGGIGVGGDIDQATLDAAGANQFSTAKQLEEQKLHGNTDLEANLAGRGILSSGAETGGLQRIQHNYEQNSTNAIQQLLAAIGGYQNDYSDKIYSLQQQKNAAREAAAGRIQADPRYQPTAGSQATRDPASGLYKTDDGRWYDANGNPVDAPGAATPANQAASSSQEFQARQAAAKASGQWTSGL